MDAQNKKTNSTSACKNCYRPKSQCICGLVIPLETQTQVLILQHPQEKLKLLNSAMLAHLTLQNSILKIGLSWPNLKKASNNNSAIPSDWAVLYLKNNNELPQKINFFTRREEFQVNPPSLKGIVILDGSWKQAHALWWRNPWLSRLHRIALNLSIGSQRNQAKTSGLSTIESLAYCLEHLEANPDIKNYLLEKYTDLIIKPNT